MIGIYTIKANDVWFAVACDDVKVFSTNFGSDEATVLHSLLRSLPFDVPFQQQKELSALARQMLALMKDVYDGKQVSQEANLAMEYLSGYTQKVLKVTSAIPIGFATTYGNIAKITGGSARAVGRVMALNPFAPIVPCHRVVCSDLTLGGYGGGLDVKLELLKREKRGYTAERKIVTDSGKLEVFPVEHVLEKIGKSKR